MVKRQQVTRNIDFGTYKIQLIQNMARLTEESISILMQYQADYMKTLMPHLSRMKSTNQNMA